MKNKYIILIILAPLAAALDQLTKWWARSLQGEPPITIIESYFHFIYVENRGAAFGLFSDMSPQWRIPFFVIISIVAIIMIFYFFRKVQDSQLVLITALSMVLGGAIGNFIDRIAYNSVIDFIDWHYKQYHWPTFNIADVFICIGVGLLIIEMFFGKSELSLFAQSAEEKDAS